MKTRNSASEVAIALLRIAVLLEAAVLVPDVPHREPGMRRGEGLDRRLGLRPRAVVGDADESGGTACRATEARQSVSARGLS